MDSFEWNKVAAALLVGLLLFMGVNLFADTIFEGEEEVVVGSQREADATAQEPEVMEEPESNFLALVVDANLSAGERTFRKCQACHTVNEGGGHRVGPNLYDVLGAPVASKDGYAYSDALTGMGGDWDYEKLNTFLENPSNAAPGTKMSFAGLRDETERANLIAYLRQQSSDPIPLPEVAAEEVQQESEEPAEEAPVSDEN